MTHRRVCDRRHSKLGSLAHLPRGHNVASRSERTQVCAASKRPVLSSSTGARSHVIEVLCDIGDQRPGEERLAHSPRLDDAEIILRQSRMRHDLGRDSER